MNMKKTLFSLAATLLAITALAGTDGALKFTRESPGGSAAWVSPAGARITTKAFVVEFWIKLAAGADLIGEMQVFDQDIQGNSGRLLIGIIKGVPRFQIGGTQQNANTKLTPGVWYHVACRRYTDGSMYIYVNDTNDSKTENLKNTATIADTDIVIGYLVRGNTTAFDGELSEVRVWNVDRTQGTIFANYTRRMKGDESGLQYCWPMDDGSGTTCRELVAGKAATINKTDNVGWSDTMLPFVLSKQTLSASTSEKLFIGDGTLAVPSGADVTLSGGYTLDARNSGAGVIDVGEGATLTVSGAGTATQGGFVKTGAGTFTAANCIRNSGGAVVSAGTLALGAQSLLAKGYPIRVMDGAAYDVAGSGFLYNMVRIMVGTMLRIGMGYDDLSAIENALASPSRENAGDTAPAHGLTLWRVEYDAFDTEAVLKGNSLLSGKD